MKKLMMIGLMAIAPLIATPSHSITPETIKLALAGTGWIGSIAQAISNGPGPHNLPIIGLLGGAGWVLGTLAEQSQSLLIKGTSKAIIGYSGLVLAAQLLAKNADSLGFDTTGTFLYRAVAHLVAIGYGVAAADGTKDIINGIAEKFESNPKQMEQPVNQIVQSSHYNHEPSDQEIFLDAIRRGDLITVRQYIAAGIDVNQLIESGWQGAFLPLATAANMSQYTIVKTLLDAGADVNARIYGGTTLLYALGNTDIVRLLLQHGADTNARDSFDNTLLHVAIDQSYDEAESEYMIESIKILLEYGADTTISRSSDGCTPYDLAIKYGHQKTAQILAEHEKNITNKETQ